MSSDDPFQYFGLDQRTATSVDVKRAYAVRLKVTRPEDDPQGFMQLRSMLERGLNQVKWRDLYGNDEDDDAYTDDDDDGDEVIAMSGETVVTLKVVRKAADEDETLDEETGERRVDRHPALTERTHPFFNRPQPADEEDPDAFEDDGDVDALEFNPEAVDTVMDDIIDLLTGPWGGAARKTLQQKLDATEISGIDEYQELSSRVREFLCDRTGFYIENMKAPIRPPWLTADVMDALESHFGWSRQASTMSWEQKQNSWVARLVQSPAEIAAITAWSKSEPLITATGTSAKGSRYLNWIVWALLGVTLIRIAGLFFQ